MKLFFKISVFLGVRRVARGGGHGAEDGRMVWAEMGEEGGYDFTSDKATASLG